MKVCCRIRYPGDFELEVPAGIREYCGSMPERGAVTFWEEFNLDTPREKQYDIYGDKFGKSLCHAWSASPV